MLYVLILYMSESRNLQFAVASEQQIFEELFHDKFIYSQSFCQKSAEWKYIFFSYFVLCLTQALCLINQHTTAISFFCHIKFKKKISDVHYLEDTFFYTGQMCE